jgi:hypothetical protein
MPLARHWTTPIAIQSADAQDRLREAADELMRAIAAVMLELGKQPSG